MDPAKIGRVEKLFHKARQRPAEEQQAFVAEACPDDADVRERVLFMLRHAASDAETAPMGEQVAHAVRQSGGMADLEPDEVIGRYRIVRKIGAGGMGVVYEARQTEPVQRDVALKLIKIGMDTKEVIGRFETERQALALMNHPNVARVLDAGATDGGRPYFVMEFVKGVPITEHCDRHRLSIDERLALFMQVCEAVQHAHQKGIIHRDLKPRNILVEYADGKATPKVIDFGIAKATDRRLTEQTVFTQHGQFIGTPEYMSPEQAEPTAQDIDTRSDVYSLGVLLYELLTGAVPLDAESIREVGYAAIQRLIREHDPAKPSTKLSSLSTTDTERVTELVKQRRTDLRSLARQLRGDLDWIVMKALEKDRGRRYGSASEFAADVQRHLAHVPVVAGPPSAAYQFRKFVRRNRGKVFAGAAIGVVLVAATAVSTTFGVIADAERDKAEAALERAESAMEHLERILTAPASEGYDVTVREMVASAELPNEGDPVTRAEVLRILGGSLEAVGDYETAEARLTEARRTLLETGETVNAAVVGIDLGAVESQFGDKTAAEPLLRDSLDALQAAGDSYWQETVRAHNALGEHVAAAGQLDEGIEHFNTAIDLLKAHNASKSTDMAISLAGLAVVDWQRNQPAAALPRLEQALAILRDTAGEGHRFTVGVLQNLAATYYEVRRHEEGDQLYESTIARAREKLGDDHPVVAVCLDYYGSAVVNRGDRARGAALIHEALQIREARLGRDSPATVRNMVNYLNASNTLPSNLAEREDIARHYLRIQERQHEDLSQPVLYALQHLNAILRQRGCETDEAVQLARRAVAAQTHLNGADNDHTNRARCQLAELLEARGEMEDSLRVAAEGLRLIEQNPNGYAYLHVRLQRLCGRLLVALGRYAEAEPFLLSAHARLNEVHPGHGGLDLIEAHLVDLYRDWHAAEPDGGYDEKAAEWQAKTHPPPADTYPSASATP